MLTPKEKAEELAYKYVNLVTTWSCYSDSDIFIEDRMTDMKKCALIAVNEILDKDGYNNDYWKDVKTEIENL